MMNQVEYLGMSISYKGMSPVLEKAQAIQEAPGPQDVSQLRSLICMIITRGIYLICHLFLHLLMFF